VGLKGAVDHVVVLERALEQLPAEWRSVTKQGDDLPLVVHATVRWPARPGPANLREACSDRNTEISIGMEVAGPETLGPSVPL
jgi:hypothetical protein